MNYIENFINQLLKEKKHIEKNDNKVIFCKKDIEVINDSSVNFSVESEPNQPYIKKNIQKELISFLDNNSALDNSLLKMNKEIKKENNKWEITFVENTKSLKWILIQFVVGVLLIWFTYSYVQKNPVEKKFLNSSISLWINTFQNLAWKIWWVFSEKVNDNYIAKRKEMIEKLVSYEIKVKQCLENTNNKNKQKNLSKLLYKIQTFKNFLMDTNNLSLQAFINNYTQYNLYVFSIQKTISDFCK